MICPRCGLNQLDGGECIQCGMVLGEFYNDFKEKNESKLIKNEYKLKKIQDIIITTGPSIENRKILSYKGLISAGAIVKLDVIEQFVDSIKDVGGIRNTPLFDLLKKAETIALSDLKVEASRLDANAVIGLSMKYELRLYRALLIYIAGTAVKILEEV